MEELSLAQAARQARAPRRLPLSPTGLLALCLCFIALGAAVWVATFIFDRVPHVEDDVAFLFQARTLAAGMLLAPIPPKPEFFDIPFTVFRDGHWFGKYPPGYPAVLALGVLAGAPWLVGPVAGALTAGLIYLLGRRLYGAWLGLLGAALAVASPFFLLQAGSYMSHVVALGLATLFMLLFLRARDRSSLLSALAAGAVLGILFLSRQLTAVGVGLPFALWGLFELARSRRRLPFYLAMAGAFLPFVVGLLAYNALTTGDPLRSAYELYWDYDKVGFGPDVGIRGHYWADGLLNTRVNVEALSSYLFGWPAPLSLAPGLLALALAAARLLWAGGAWAWGKIYAPSPSQGEGWGEGTPHHESGIYDGQDRPSPLPSPRRGEGEADPAGKAEVSLAGYDLLLFAVVASLVALHAAYWAFGQMYGPRYYFEALGAMVLLSARGLAQVGAGLAALLRRSLRARARLAAGALVGLAVLGLFAWAYTNWVPVEFGKTVRWYDIDNSGPRQVDAAGVRNAVVFVKRGYWTEYAPFFIRNDPLLRADVVYAVDLGARNEELLALYPGRDAYRYADGRLERLR